MLSGPSIDPQINGVRNDGSAHGIVDINQVSGPLVNVPFREGHFSVSGSSLSVDVTAGATNDDGSMTWMQFAVPTTVPAPTPGYIRWMFYGTTLGVRFDPTFTSGGGGLYGFDVIVDRVPYHVDKALYYDDTNAAWNIAGNGAHGVIVARDLPDTVHYAEINITPQAGVNGQIIYGFIADAKRYRQYPPRGYLNTTTSLTTAMVAVNIGGNAQTRGHGLRSIIYANVDSETRVVTVEQNGVTIWAATIEPNMSDVFDPKTLIAFLPGLLVKHKVDRIATTAVKATVIGGN